MNQKNILFIIGSFREQSFNHQLAKETENLLKNKANITYLDYHNVPFFNQDLEKELPESVIQVKEQVKNADAIWIFTPEYNHMIPGVLKNLLDWLSRGNPSVLKDKFVTFSSAAGGSGGASVRDQMIQLLNQVMMKVMSMPNTGIVVSGKSFTSNILELEPVQKKFLNAQAEAFLTFINH